MSLSLGPYVVFCQKVQDHVGTLVMEHFNDDVEVVMRDPILFGDFRTALQEEEARIYEDIQDYEAAKALFQVCMGRALLHRLTFPGSASQGSHALRGCSGGGVGEGPRAVSQGSECELVSHPVTVVHGNDLWSVLHTQAPRFTPLGFQSSSPWRVPGFQCPARFGNHSAPCCPFSF